MEGRKKGKNEGRKGRREGGRKREKHRERGYLGAGVAVAYSPVPLLLSGGLELAAACLHRLYIV